MKPQHRRSSKTVWALLLGLAAAISLAIVLAQAAQPGSTALSSPTVGSQSAGVTPSSPAATDIAVPTPSVTYAPRPINTAVPTPDERITETYVATVLIGRTAVGATADYVDTHSPETPMAIPTGIFEGGGDVFHYPSDDVIIQNMWTGELSNHSYGASVWAGSLHSDTTQGLVLVMIEGPVFTYLSPVKAGSLRIIAEQNLRLTLLSTNGTTFYFDVPGQRFVSSLAQAVPTVTPFHGYPPAPTGTPVPTQPLVPTCTPGPTPAIATSEPNCLAN